MIAMWIAFYLAGGIPELQTKPVEIGMHILGGTATAVPLLMGRTGLLTRRPWGCPLSLFSVGMLTYTLIMNPGYFLQE